MEPIVMETTFAAGLSREEYIRSQELINRVTNGRRLAGGRWFILIMMGLSVLTAAAAYRVSGEFDTSLAALITLMFIAELWMMLSMPRQLRRRAGEIYDVTVATGYVFDGVVTVTENDVQKQTTEATTRIPFDRCSLYLEAEDMVIFCINGSKAVAIPARCLTTEDAQAIRQAAHAGIAATRRCVVQAVVPLAEYKQPLPPLTPAPAEEALCTVDFEYTAGELRGEFAEGAMRRFVAAFPQRLLSAVFFTVMISFVATVPLLPLCALCLIGLFVWEVAVAWIRATRAVRITEGEVCRGRLELTDRYVTVHGKTEAARRLKIPWEHITRAVERPHVVEFTMGEGATFLLPKRCIPDMDTLRGVVDAHLKR